MSHQTWTWKRLVAAATLVELIAVLNKAMVGLELRLRPPLASTITASTTLDDSYGRIFANGVSITLTLPPAIDLTRDEIQITNVNATSLTINPDGSDTIAGLSSIVLLQWESVRLSPWKSTEWVFQ